MGSADLQVAPRLAHLGDMPVIRAAAAPDYVDPWQTGSQLTILGAKLHRVSFIDFGGIVELGVTLA